MDELNGEIVCAVEKWCKLIAGLSSGQRAALAETPLRSMLQIPSLKMRTLLIRTGRKKPFSPRSQQPLVPAVQPGLNMRD